MSTPTTQQPPPPPKSAPPVSILPTQLAKTYATLHPLCLLALLALRFNALVADPVGELLSDLPFLAALQVAYVTICLPAAGTVVDDDESKEKEKKAAVAAAAAAGNGAGNGTGAGVVRRPGKRGYRRKANGSSSGVWTAVLGKVIPSLLSLTLTTLLATPILAITLVLFGAPVTTHHAETALCAAHMAVLAATALIYVHGVDGHTWKEVWGVQRPADAVWGSALGTCVGAWFGAVPVPLDWDRPWQAWPITILTGAYIGYCVGGFVGRCGGVFGKRIVFEVQRGVEEEGEQGVKEE